MTDVRTTKRHTRGGRVGTVTVDERGEKVRYTCGKGERALARAREAIGKKISRCPARIRKWTGDPSTTNRLSRIVPVRRCSAPRRGRIAAIRFEHYRVCRSGDNVPSSPAQNVVVRRLFLSSIRGDHRREELRRSPVSLIKAKKKQAKRDKCLHSLFLEELGHFYLYKQINQILYYVFLSRARKRNYVLRRKILIAKEWTRQPLSGQMRGTRERNGEVGGSCFDRDSLPRVGREDRHGSG